MLWLLKLQLGSRKTDKRVAAVLRLARNGKPKAIDAIIGALSDDTGWPETVSVVAARVLGKLREKRAIPRLLEVFRAEGHPALTSAAGEALMMIGTPGAIESLCRIAREGGSLRNSAVLALMYTPPDHPEIERVVSALCEVFLSSEAYSRFERHRYGSGIHCYEPVEYINATRDLARILVKTDHPFSSELKNSISAHAGEILLQSGMYRSTGSAAAHLFISEIFDILGALGNKRALFEYLLLPRSLRTNEVGSDHKVTAILTLRKLHGEAPPEKGAEDWWLENKETLVPWAYGGELQLFLVTVDDLERLNQQEIGQVFTRHWDQSVRKAAVETLEDQALLGEIARDDGDQRMRLAAAEKLADLEVAQDVYAQIARGGLTHSVRKSAMERLENQAPLADIAQNDDDKDMRLAAVGHLRDQSLLATVATRDELVEVRRAAVNRLTDQSLLAEIARKGGNWRVRRAAVRKLDDPTTLAQVSKSGGNKRLCEAAATRLEQLRDEG